MLNTRLTDFLEAADIDEVQRRQAFYEWAGDDKRAEFINGEVILPSPTPSRNLEAEQNLTMLLRVFVDLNKLGEVASARAMGFIDA